MGMRVVKQPNGKFAVFSDVVDHFTGYGYTKAQMVHAWEQSREKTGFGPLTHTEAVEKVERADRDEPWQARWPEGTPTGLGRWEEAVNTAKRVHGDDAELQQVMRIGTAGLKVYGWNHVGKQRAIVAAKTVAEVIRYSGATASAIRDYGCWTGNAEEIATALRTPGRVIYRPL